MDEAERRWEVTKQKVWEAAIETIDRMRKQDVDIDRRKGVSC